MEFLKDPNIKEQGLIATLFSDALVIGAIFILATYGAGWMLIIIKALIVILFCTGVLCWMQPIMDHKDPGFRRISTLNVYISSTLKVSVFWFITGMPVYTALYFISAVLISTKYLAYIEEVDHLYTKKMEAASKFVKSLSKRIDKDYWEVPKE